MKLHMFAPLAVASALATSAAAHATLETPQAPAGSYYKAVMRVPHGCSGQATHTVAIDVPEGLIGAKPMPKPGWTLTTDVADYQHSYTNHGRKVTRGVVRVTWSGGELPNDWYDEFVFRGKLAGSLEPGQVLYFKTYQTCADGAVNWAEIPAQGQDRHDLKRPAPALTITAPHEHSH